MSKIKVTINDKVVEVDSSVSVFQAAEQCGVFVPHYCYHPDLSVAGVCRMCMVEIEGVPRLQISCNTPVKDGMVVRTTTPKVNESVKSTLELHLINHPLDCPICDKAGECKLQDFYQNYGLYESRMVFEKVHKPKVVDIGPIMLDSERCILCTRCVRFCDEVTHSNELGIFNRGDRAELKTYDDGPLKNEYTGNLADICPVGALTAKDFRFECRVWFLEKTKSICTMCAMGCNTEVSVRTETKEIYRVEPRRNPDVNKSWICDTGRWDFRYVNEDRVEAPIRKEASGWMQESWHAIFADLKNQITSHAESVAIGLSTQLTNEELYDAFTSLTALGVKHFTLVADESATGKKDAVDGILKHADQTSNFAGAQKIAKALKVKLLSFKDLVGVVNSQSILSVIVLGLERTQPQGLSELISAIGDKTVLTLHATNRSVITDRVNLVLPAVTSFEKNGTAVNAVGRLQKIQKVVEKQQMARNVHDLLLGIRNGGDRAKTVENAERKLYEDKLASLFSSEPQFRKFPPMGVALDGGGA